MQAHCDNRLHLDDWCNLPERRSPGSLGHSLWLIKAKLIFFANSDSSMTSFIQIKVHRLLKPFIPLLWDYQIWNVCYKNTCTSPITKDQINLFFLTQKYTLWLRYWSGLEGLLPRSTVFDSTIFPESIDVLKG